MLQSARPRSSHHFTLLTHHRFTLSMHADTPRPPQASGCIKVSQCQLKTELTTAPEACPSVRETYVKEAFVSFGHYLLRPPGQMHCCNRYRSIRLRLMATQTVGGLAFTVTSSIREVYSVSLHIYHKSPTGVSNPAKTSQIQVPP